MCSPFFAHPQQEITRSFVDSTTNLNKVEDLLEEGAEITRLKPGEKLVRLSYQRGKRCGSHCFHGVPKLRGGCEHPAGQPGTD